MEAKRGTRPPRVPFSAPSRKIGMLGAFESSRRHWGQDAGREGASRHARGGRAPQNVLPNAGLTERISPFSVFPSLDVGCWMLGVRCSGSPATPLGLEKIMDDVTQGSPTDGTTLGWMMQSRWDWERPVHSVRSFAFYAFSCGYSRVFRGFKSPPPVPISLNSALPGWF
jgi:hypothetical protein